MMIKTIWTRIIIRVSGFLGLGRRLGLVGSRMMVRLVRSGLVVGMGLVGMVGLSINTSYADLSGLYRSVNAARQSGLWSTGSGSNITIHQDRGLVNAKHEYHGQLIIEKHEKLGIDQVRGDQTLTLILDGGMIMKGMIESVGRGVGHMVIIGKHGDMIITDHGQIHLGSFGMVNQDPLGLTENHGNIQVTRGNPIIIAAGGITNDQGGVETHANQARAILEFNPVNGVLTYVASKPNPEEDGQMLFDDSGTQIVYQGNTGGDKRALNNPKLITNVADFVLYNFRNNYDYGRYSTSTAFFKSNNFTKITIDLDFDYNANYFRYRSPGQDHYRGFVTESFVVNYNGASHVMDHVGNSSGSMPQRFLPSLDGSAARTNVFNFKLFNAKVYNSSFIFTPYIGSGVSCAFGNCGYTDHTANMLAGDGLLASSVHNIVIKNALLDLKFKNTTIFSIGILATQSDNPLISHIRVQNSNIHVVFEDAVEQTAMYGNIGGIIGTSTGLFPQYPRYVHNYTASKIWSESLLSIIESSSFSGSITGLIDHVSSISVGFIEGKAIGRDIILNNNVGKKGDPAIMKLALTNRRTAIDDTSQFQGKNYLIGGILGSARMPFLPYSIIKNNVYVAIQVTGVWDGIGGFVGGFLNAPTHYPTPSNDPRFNSSTVTNNVRSGLNFYKDRGDITIQGSAVAMGGLVGAGTGIVKYTQLNVNLNNGYVPGSTGGLIGYAGGYTQTTIDYSKVVAFAGYSRITVTGNSLTNWYSGEDSKYNVLIDHTTVTGSVNGSGNVGGFIGTIGIGDTALNDLIKNKTLPVVITNSSFGTILPPPVKGVINVNDQILTNNSSITGETVGGMIGKIENTNYTLNVENSYVIANIATSGQGAGIIAGIPTDVNGNIIPGYDMHIQSVFTSGMFTANEDATDIAGISVYNSGTIENVYVVGEVINDSGGKNVNLSMFVNHNLNKAIIKQGYFAGSIATNATAARPGIAENNGEASELYWNIQVEPFSDNTLGEEPYLKGVPTAGFNTTSGPIGKFGSAWTINAAYGGSILTKVNFRIQEAVLHEFNNTTNVVTGALNPEDMNYGLIQINNQWLKVRNEQYYQNILLYYQPQRPLIEIVNLLRIARYSK